jgi:hypothetical protein
MRFESSDPLRILRLLAASHALGSSKSWEVPPAADRALQGGVYSDALAELAALREPIMSEVAPLLESALNELGEPIPSMFDAVQTLTRYCVERIAESTASPVELLSFLWWDLAFHKCVPQGKYAGESLDICLLLGIYDSYSEPDENLNELDRLAREAAKEWLQRHPV